MKYIFISFFLFVHFLSLAQSRTESLILSRSKEKFSFMNTSNAEKLKPFLDERLVFIHSNGLTESKDLMIQNLKDKKWQLKSVDIKEATVRVYKNNFAIIIGKGIFHAIVNETEVDTSLHYTEVWTHVKGGWLLASRQASKIQ